MDIKPLGDRIVVQPLEAEEVTKGGIILTETAKEKPHEGKIVAVGRGKVLDNGQVQALELKSRRPRTLRKIQRQRNQDQGRQGLASL